MSTLLSDAFVYIVSSPFLFYITFSFLMCSHSLLIFNIYCIWFLSFYHFSSLLMCPSDILLHFLLFFIACCPPLIFIYLVSMFLLMLSLFPLYVRCSNASLIFIVRLYSFPFLPFPPTSLISWRIPPSLFLWIFFRDSFHLEFVETKNVKRTDVLCNLLGSFIIPEFWD